jgi:hypothetical protein
VGQTNQEKTPPPPETRHEATLLYTLVAARSVTVGELIDYANGIPAQWLPATAVALGSSIASDYRRGKRAAARKRRLVILGALITRLAFEVEKVPRNRSAKI